MRMKGTRSPRLVSKSISPLFLPTFSSQKRTRPDQTYIRRKSTYNASISCSISHRFFGKQTGELIGIGLVNPWNRMEELSGTERAFIFPSILLYVLEYVRCRKLSRGFPDSLEGNQDDKRILSEITCPFLPWPPFSLRFYLFRKSVLGRGLLEKTYCSVDTHAK